MKTRLSTMEIEKKGEDRYHAVVDDELTFIDEDVDGPQLLGMLSSKELVGTTAENVLAEFDQKKTGGRLSVRYLAVVA